MHLEGEDSVFRQKQVLAAKSLLHQFRLVLTGYCEKNASLGQRPQQLLINRMQMTLSIEIPGNVRHSDLSQDALPKGAVEVGDQTLLRRWVVEEIGQHSAYR